MSTKTFYMASHMAISGEQKATVPPFLLNVESMSKPFLRKVRATDRQTDKKGIDFNNQKAEHASCKFLYI